MNIHEQVHLNLILLLHNWLLLLESDQDKYCHCSEVIPWPTFALNVCVYINAVTALWHKALQNAISGM